MTPEISVQELRDAMVSGDDLFLLDVREADSAAKSKLSGSTNVSRGLIEMKVPKLYPDSSTVILTHCGGGGRASLAAYTLKQMGYRNVYAITAPYQTLREVFE